MYRIIWPHIRGNLNIALRRDTRVLKVFLTFTSDARRQPYHKEHRSALPRDETVRGVWPDDSTDAETSKNKDSSAQFLSSLKTLRSEERHRDVLELWGRNGSARALNNKVLTCLVASASKVGDMMFIIDIVELAVDRNIQPEQGTVCNRNRNYRCDNRN